MRLDFWNRYSTAKRRVTQWWRWERRSFHRWVETTENFLHLAVILIVPLLLALVTWLANVTPFVTFLVYPPLASGTYTLFADPESEYSSPRRFVGGITLGALCGWVALVVTAEYLYHVPPEQIQVHAGATALSIFLTGILTWLFNLEEPTAFSAALLALVSGSAQFAYVVGIAVSSSIVALAFSIWYNRFYEHRAQYLFKTVTNDDRILVPIRSDADDETALFAAYIAAAHESGKIVLYETIPEEQETTEEPSPGDDLSPEESSTSLLFEGGSETELPTEAIPAETMQRLQSIEDYVEETVDIPCEMVVARGDPDDPLAVRSTANEVNCDLIISSYEIGESHAAERPSFIIGLFRGDTDVIAFHTTERQTSWSRVLVMVRRSGELSNAMLDFAKRIVPSVGNVTVCTCISDTSERSRATATLRDLASSFDTPIETRVSYQTVEEYLATHSNQYDLAMIGASTDRGSASRLVSPPTFERLEAIESDLAIVHRG